MAEGPVSREDYNNMMQGCLFAALIIAVIVGIVFYCMGRSDGTNSMQREAVKLWHGCYAPDSMFYPEFRWQPSGDVPKPEKPAGDK